MSPKIWTERWDNDTQLLALYLLTNRNRKTEGLYVLPRGYILADLGWEPHRLESSFAALLAQPVGATDRKGFMDYDEEAQVILLRQALEYQAPENPNQRKGAVRALEELPPTPLLDELCRLAAERAARLRRQADSQEARALAASAEAFATELSERFGRSGNGSGSAREQLGDGSGTVEERPGNGSGTVGQRSGNGSGTVGDSPAPARSPTHPPTQAPVSTARALAATAEGGPGETAAAVVAAADGPAALPAAGAADPMPLDASLEEQFILRNLWSLPRWPPGRIDDLALVRELREEYPHTVGDAAAFRREVRRMSEWWRPKDSGRSAKPPNWRMRLRNWCETAEDRKAKRAQAREENPGPTPAYLQPMRAMTAEEYLATPDPEPAAGDGA